LTRSSIPSATRSIPSCSRPDTPASSDSTHASSATTGTWTVPGCSRSVRTERSRPHLLGYRDRLTAATSVSIGSHSST
jgi:hypothetical protein